jgi:hypothetical protein
MIRVDDELGEIRWCERCAEWWPNDSTFWHFSTYHAGDVAGSAGKRYIRRTSGVAASCRACHGEAVRIGHIRRANDRGVTGHRCRGADCPVWVPVGRSKCYSCSGADRRPMTLAVLEELTA